MKEGVEGAETGEEEAAEAVEVNYKDVIYGDREKDWTEFWVGGPWVS